MSHILSSQVEGVLTLSLNRPEKLNAITSAMYLDLVAGLRTASAESGIRAVLLRAEGAHFTAGNDINDFMSAASLDMDTPGFQFIRAIHEFEKPLIAVVQGRAVGIGTTALLHCDVVFAHPSANFSMPFVTLGLVPEAGSSYLFTELVGYQKAAEIFFSGESFDAQAAKEMGLVTRVSEDADSLAKSFAEKIALQPSAAIANTKALLKSKSYEAVNAVIRAEAELFAQAIQSNEAQEAFMRFLSRKG